MCTEFAPATSFRKQQNIFTVSGASAYVSIVQSGCQMSQPASQSIYQLNGVWRQAFNFLSFNATAHDSTWGLIPEQSLCHRQFQVQSVYWYLLCVIFASTLSISWLDWNNSTENKRLKGQFASQMTEYVLYHHCSYRNSQDHMEKKNEQGGRQSFTLCDRMGHVC